MRICRNWGVLLGRGDEADEGRGYEMELTRDALVPDMARGSQI